MERIKWFDFLGALLLLFTVTKSAITPHVSDDSSSLTPVPTTSMNDTTISSRDGSERTFDEGIEPSNFSMNSLLDEFLNSSNFEGSADSNIGGGTEGRDLHQGLDLLPDSIFYLTHSPIAAPVFMW
jgi:hypothetical protein